MPCRGHQHFPLGRRVKEVYSALVDDIGMVTSIKVWGPSVETKKTEFFKRAE